MVGLFVLFVQSLSRVWLFVTPWITARQAVVHQQLPEFTQTHVHWVSDAIQPSHPLSFPSPPAPKSLPASGSFPMSQLFAWGGQSTGVSASASFLPKKSQGWSPSEWTGWISLQSKGLSESSPTPQVLLVSPFYWWEARSWRISIICLISHTSWIIGVGFAVDWSDLRTHVLSRLSW